MSDNSSGLTKSGRLCLGRNRCGMERASLGSGPPAATVAGALDAARQRAGWQEQSSQAGDSIQGGLLPGSLSIMRQLRTGGPEHPASQPAAPTPLTLWLTACKWEGLAPRTRR